MKVFGVGTLKAQNLALLVKWVVAQGILWSSVISSIYNLNRKPSNYLVRKDTTGMWINIYKVVNSLQKININKNNLFSLIP